MIRVDRKVTHGRHCLCSACAREDWTRPELACCGMHGPECPANYAPAKSIPTEPHGYRAEGDERIRTAVCAPGADPVYDSRGGRLQAWLHGGYPPKGRPPFRGSWWFGNRVSDIRYWLWRARGGKW